MTETIGTDITRRLAEHAATLSYDDIPLVGDRACATSYGRLIPGIAVRAAHDADQRLSDVGLRRSVRRARIGKGGRDHLLRDAAASRGVVAVSAGCAATDDLDPEPQAAPPLTGRLSRSRRRPPDDEVREDRS